VPAAQAQGNSYKQTNLVSDTPGVAPVIDPNLVNPWGICIIPGEAIWVADNRSPMGVTSLYSTTGAVEEAFHDCAPGGKFQSSHTDGMRRSFCGRLRLQRKQRQQRQSARHDDGDDHRHVGQSYSLNHRHTHRPITTGGAGLGLLAALSSLRSGLVNLMLDQVGGFLSTRDMIEEMFG
jgi:hypothetical protein